jgi:hypothetical protein
MLCIRDKLIYNGEATLQAYRVHTLLAPRQSSPHLAGAFAWLCYTRGATNSPFTRRLLIETRRRRVGVQTGNCARSVTDRSVFVKGL